MPDGDNENRRDQSTGRLSEFEGIIIGRERAFDVLSAVVRDLHQVVLALFDRASLERDKGLEELRPTTGRGHEGFNCRGRPISNRDA